MFARRNAIAVMIAMMTVTSAGFAQAPPPGTGSLDLKQFIRAIDGSTMEAWIDGNQADIGLVGINTPQGNTPCGVEARKTLQAIIQIGIRLDEEPSFYYDFLKRRMYYGRDQAKLASISLAMVLAGVASPNGVGKEQTLLKVAEATAKLSKRGCLWRNPPGKPGLLSASAAVPAAPSSAEVRTLMSQTEGLIAQSETKRTDAVTAAASTVVLPSGFVQETVISGLVNPTSLAFLPDGRMLVAQKNGQVMVIKNGALLSTPFIDIHDRVNDYWDHGLLGIAADPNFATNNQVYLLYTYENDPTQYNGTKTARLTRVTAVGDTASPFSEAVVLGTSTGSSCDSFPAGTDCLSSDGPSHSIGSIRFANDGTMFISVGDGASFNVVDPAALRAQNLDLLTGKILRITTSGQGVSTNPFWTGDPNVNRSKVWAYGLRNPFKFNVRPGTLIPYLGDVGWDTTEEIDVATSGGNHGWPCYEGAPQQPGYAALSQCQALYAQGAGAVIPPIVSWLHNNSSAAAVGGSFYTGSLYPAQYQGAFFFGDYAQNVIRYLTVDGQNQLLTGPNDFASHADAPVAIEMGPDGNLYYLAISTGELRRIRYSLGNSPPTAAAAANPTSGFAPLAVQFTSTGSADSDGDTLTYDWDFGDNSTHSTAASPSHTYSVNGTYSAVLTVDDGHGHTSTKSLQITVGAKAPEPTIASPSSSLQFKVGDVITYSGSAADAQDGTVAPSGLSWQVVLHHCPGGVCHIHPFSSSTGATGSFTAPDHGDSSYFEIVLTATDSVGLSSSTSVTIQPKTVQITLNSVPSGLTLVYSGQGVQTPFTASAIVGGSHTVFAPSPQTNVGSTYTWQSWSDSGAASHNFIAGSSDATLTATFQTTFSPVRINCGGMALSDASNQVWSADTGATGGQTYQNVNTITGTATPALYQSERWDTSTFLYQFTVPNGSYVVNLKFAEIYYSAAGRRVFNVTVNGQAALTNFDPFAAAGGANIAVDRAIPVTVNGGQISIRFNAVTGEPAVNAIEVVPQTGISVAVSPTDAVVNTSQQQQFTAAVSGSSNQGVTWSISPAVGSINQSGLYTAPATITTSQVVNVSATSTADSTKIGTARVTVNPGIGVAVTPGSVTLSGSQTQQFSATVSGTSNTSVTWSLNPSVGQISTGGLYTAPATIANNQDVQVIATSAADGTVTGGATVHLTTGGGSTFVPIRVNAGGGAYTDSFSNAWAADTGFTGGSTSATATAVTGTPDLGLYQSERWASGTLQYQFSVPNGNYLVNLKFAEIYYAQAGQRVFNVAINGQTVLQNFDVFAAAGGSFKAVDKPIPVAVTGGQITILFTAVAGEPKISALEITSQTGVAVLVSPPSASLTANQTQQFSASVSGTANTAVTWSLNPQAGTISSGGLYQAPASITTNQSVTVTATSVANTSASGSSTVSLIGAFTPLHVNSGGGSFTDSTGTSWTADSGYDGGNSYSSAVTVTNTTTPAVYQSERWSSGPLKYQFSVPNGNYAVNLKFAELYYTAAGKRVFNVLINGAAVLSNFDVFAAAGGANVALDRSFSTTVSNGTLTIQFVPVTAEPAINAIEVTVPAGIAVNVSPPSATLGPSQTQQFTATVSGTSQTGVVWTINPQIGTITSTGLYTAPAVVSSTQAVTVRAISSADSTASGTATVTLNPVSTFTPIRVNAGGGAFTDSASNAWSADTGFSGGNAYSTGASIAGTSDGALYQSERWSSSTLQYQFSVANGTRTVTLKFAELYYQAAGQRVFSIVINGATVLSNFDVFAGAGGTNVAIDKTFTVNVTNGQLTIQLVPVAAEPKVNAILIQ